MNISRGDIVLVDFEPVKGSEQGKVRPALVLQNNIGNIYSSLTIVSPITSKLFSKKYPTNVFISMSQSGLPKDSTILLNQIRTIDKSRIIKKYSSLDVSTMTKVDSALVVSLGITLS